jgi:hypothetical protein
MRKIRATTEQSELPRLIQACFLLLASDRENIRDHVLPNVTGPFLCAGEQCAENTLITKKVEVCSIVDIFAFWYRIQSFTRSQKADLAFESDREGRITWVICQNN